MKKKTLKQYQKEFDEIKKPNNKLDEWLPEDVQKLEELAKQCIADYPDDKQGYANLGLAITYSKEFFNDEYKQIKEISLLAIDNSRYAWTLEILTEKSSIDYDLLHLIYRIEIPIFAKTYFECGVKYTFLNDYLSASNEFSIAHKLNENFQFIKLLNPPIERIQINNLFCIKEINIDELSNKNEIYFLGENGVGKTLLLQAIVLGLIPGESNDEIYPTFSFQRDSNKQTVSEIDIRVNAFYDRINHEAYTYLNIFAYGVSRFREGDKIDKTGYSTLFNRDSLLTNPENWFEKVWLREKAKVSSLSIDIVLDFFIQIIDFENTNDFKIVHNESKFIFYERETLTEFEHLADGYRSVLIWLCDLLSRLTENQPYIKELKDFYGIVLVDEIDMFLHPKWEYNIVKKLREKLPNIQWFFTTHSPMLILGASEDAVFYKLYKEDGKTQISEQYTYQQISNLLANGIITSPLFDMEYSGMREQSEKEHPDIDTNDTYLHSRINKFILKKSIEAKKIKTYIPPATIDQWINEAMELNKAGKL